MDKLEVENKSKLMISDISRTDLILSILHLKEASELLKNHEAYKDISNILLQLTKTLFDNGNLLSSDISSIENLKKEITIEK